jgi:hypothetical protein
MYAIEMTSCGLINISGFMKIVTGVQVILRFVLGNLSDCNAGVT